MVVVAFIAFVFGLCLIISLHEFGHFIFAKKAGILCYDYSIGMGPLIKGWKKGETLIGIRCIPLGGFVSMADGDMANQLINVSDKEDENAEPMEVGLNLAENNVVSEIILNKARNFEVYGKVVARDLYGKDDAEMFIELESDGIVNRYSVTRDTVVVLKPKSEVKIAPYDRCFESKTKWQRFITLFAGPGMNFILAFVLFLFAGFMVGKPSNDPVAGAITQTIKVKNGEYDSPAVSAGIKKGDTILSVNGKNVEEIGDLSIIKEEILNNDTVTISYSHKDEDTIYNREIRPIVYLGNLGVIGNLEEVSDETTTYKQADIDGALVFLYTTKAEKAGLANYDIITKIDDTDIHNWSDLVKFCLNVEDGKEVDVTVKRKDETKTLEKVPLLSRETIDGLKDVELIKTEIGVSASYKFNFFYSFWYSIKNMGSSVASVFKTLKLLFISKDVGVSDLSGPVGIYSMIKNSLLGGFSNYIYFLGFLSVNIGIVNLLPIPALDGGRIVFLGYEAITRKKVKSSVENAINNVCFWLLMALFLYITVNDILRLF